MQMKCVLSAKVFPQMPRRLGERPVLVIAEEGIDALLRKADLGKNAKVSTRTDGWWAALGAGLVMRPDGNGGLALSRLSPSEKSFVQRKLGERRGRTLRQLTY